MHLSRSELARHVKSLDITLENPYEYSTLGASGNGDAGKQLLVFFQDLTQCLPLCIQAFRNLRSLDMICSGGTFDDRPEELVPVEHCLQVDTMIAAVLTHLPLDCLEDLAIRVPCTRDIHTIMRYNSDRAYSQCRLPLAKIMSSLRSLRLKICDNSGPQGQRYFHKETSVLLRTFGSQKQYAKSLFDFAGMATALESLAICCTAPLNFDLLVTNRLHSLKNVSLTCVQTNGEHLLHLLAQNKTTLESITFTQVELTSRTWEDVLVPFCYFPLLIHVWIQDSGYGSDGTSSRFHVSLLPEIDNPQSLESYRFRDICALGDVMRLVNERRRKRNLCEVSEPCERSIFLQPLADCNEADGD